MIVRRVERSAYFLDPGGHSGQHEQHGHDVAVMMHLVVRHSLDARRATALPKLCHSLEVVP